MSYVKHNDLRLPFTCSDPRGPEAEQPQAPLGSHTVYLLTAVFLGNSHKTTKNDKGE